MGELLNILKIVVPIIIVLIGSIDLIKAVVSNTVDEDMKKASQKLLKRFILGVCVFFVTAIVQLILSLAGSKMDNRCFNCVVDVNGNKCNKEKIDKCKRYGTTQPKDSNAKNNSPTTPDNSSTISEDITNGKRGTCLDGAPINITTECITSDIEERKEYFKCGEYPDLNPYDNPSIYGTLDSVIIYSKTRVILYAGKNFTGDIILDEKGYMNIMNSYWKEKTNGDGKNIFLSIIDDYDKVDEKYKKWSNNSFYLNDKNPNGASLELRCEMGAFCGSMKVICED